MLAGNLSILRNEDLDSIKGKTNEMALSSDGTYDNVLQNLSQSKFIAFQNLCKIDLIIQKSDKGSSLLILDRHYYIKNIENILNKQNKFVKANMKVDCLLNFTVNQGKHVYKILGKLVGSNIMQKK